MLLLYYLQLKLKKAKKQMGYCYDVKVEALQMSLFSVGW